MRKLVMEQEDFNKMIVDMPTPWLLQYYKVLHKQNEELHTLIDTLTDENHDILPGSDVVDEQIECFNRMLAVGNVLTYRDVPLPNVQTSIR